MMSPAKSLRWGRSQYQLDAASLANVQYPGADIISVSTDLNTRNVINNSPARNPHAYNLPH